MSGSFFTSTHHLPHMKRAAPTPLFATAGESVQNRMKVRMPLEVIEISSDEEYEGLVISHPSPTKSKSRAPWENSRSAVPVKPALNSATDDDVIELTDTSSDELEIPPTHNDTQIIPQKENLPISPVPTVPWATSDPAIFILNDPKDASRPVKSPTKPRPPELSIPAVASSMPTLKQRRSPTKVGTGVDKTRESYAQDLFNTLNTLVFDNRLPSSTRLVWNTRLLSTAGRAKFRKSKDGTESSEIELASKILDCEERIRFTLAHEMCHLATWVIDRNLQESHGPRFKSWASRVMRLRSDIVISTRHNYEIKYPYQWRCQQCNRIYGRFSRSIKPDEVLCGACKTGRLEPMFKTRVKKTAASVSPFRRKKLDDETITDDGEDLEDIMNKIQSVMLDE